MEKKYLVLLVIDNASREQRGALFLKNELEKTNFCVKLISRYVLKEAFYFYKPDIVFLPKLHKIPILKIIYKYSFVILLSSESFSGNELSTVHSYIGDHLNNNKYIDLRCCWGLADYEAIIKHNLFPENKLIITGHPITEYWYHNKKDNKKINRSPKPIIGITSTLRVLSNIIGQRNNLQLLQSIESNTDANGASLYFDPPEHAEWWFAFEAAFIRVILNIADFFHNYEIHIRPHPLENPNDYIEVFKKNLNIKVSVGEDLGSWLSNVDVVLSYLSMSQIDAFRMGKKVISIKNLLPIWLTSRMPKRLKLEVDNFFVAPSSLELLKKEIEKQEYQSNRKARKFLLKVFNFPSSKPSSLISLSLNRMITESKLKPKIKKLPYAIRYFIYPDLLMFIQDVKGKLTGHNFGHSYCKHKFIRNYRFGKSLTYEKF